MVLLFLVLVWWCWCNIWILFKIIKEFVGIEKENEMYKCWVLVIKCEINFYLILFKLIFGKIIWIGKGL